MFQLPFHLVFLYLLFHLPAVFWTFLNLVQLGTNENLSFDSLIFSYLLILFPLIAFIGPFSMGAGNVSRLWARDEHSFVWAHFFSGVKENWKQGLLFGVINGLMPLAAWLSFRFYSGMVSQSALYYLPLAVTVGAYLIWNLCAPVLPAMLTGYELPFFTALKNALLMTIAELPRSFGTLIATLIIPILMTLAFFFLPAALNYLVPIAFVFYAVIGLSLNKLIAASHANMVCEKYLNTQIDGAMVNIGLRSASKNKLD